MQTNLSSQYQGTEKGEQVESILRKCVHCGFCNATCPTYQLLGDELDGPRGRIYQMKQFFEGAPANQDFLKHLDRCLTCRSCETTCPSGVKYSHLLEIGREEIEQALPRKWTDRVKRKALVSLVTNPALFNASITVGRIFKPVMPAFIADSIPDKQQPLPKANGIETTRSVILLKGCAQPTLTPNTNIATTNLLSRLGVKTIELSQNQCCGAAASHTSDHHRGDTLAKNLIDLWWPYIESGVEAIIVSATGCGVAVKDFGRIFVNDNLYSEKARKVSELYCDPLEYFEKNLDSLMSSASQSDQRYQKIAFHTPCTMQHGLGINNRVEKILEKAGYEICPVSEPHLCCGSAGTYSLLQPEISNQLRDNKQQALQINQPDIVATANIGCQMQIAKGLKIPVVHWIELLEKSLGK